MSIKINQLMAENVKRIKAVKIEPTKTGLTIIGGDNRQGKTSVLDTLAWALGGNRYKPSEPQRRDSTIPPNIRVELSNGLIVERKGKNSDLRVTDPEGKAYGQALLNKFVEALAIDLPKFMEMNNREKADVLLQIIGVGDKLKRLEVEEQELYNERLAIGRIADQKEKFAKEMPHYRDVPKVPVSATDLIKQQQEILAQNGENQRKRENLAELERNLKTNTAKQRRIQEQIAELTKKHEILVDEGLTIIKDIEIAKKTVEELQDESTAELESSIANIEELNQKIRANQDREQAKEEANEHKARYDKMTASIEEVRKEKMDLLKNAKLPLEGLSVEDGELTYNGDKWDNMAGSDQLIVATAIVRELNPGCGFVLMDKLEQFDLATLTEFGEWIEKEGLQAIATRVSTGEECSIIIEDGYVKGQPRSWAEKLVSEAKEKQEDEPKWKAGEF